jgi:N-acetylglucosaminyldiphosphoundecaprenol N-acetyl-beta-D-mannosaminyltransferase
MKRIEFLGCPIDVINMAETVNVIIDRIKNKKFTQHVVVNVAKIVNMQKDSFLDQSVRESDIINIDGMGVLIGARFLGHDAPSRVAGIDLFHELLVMCGEKKYPVFLLGATEEVVSSVVDIVNRLYTDIEVAGYHHGFFWDDEVAVVNEIKDSGAKLLFVAITSPKKENFINKWKEELGVDFVMGVGGTFDVVAGKVKRAPKWMQDYGLEWFYRIAQEPRRMWKRYAITNSIFAWMLIKAKLGLN